VFFIESNQINEVKLMNFAEYETAQPGVKHEEVSHGEIFINVLNHNMVINIVS
jgi:hypothetical protein